MESCDLSNVGDSDTYFRNRRTTGNKLQFSNIGIFPYSFSKALDDYHM